MVHLTNRRYGPAYAFAQIVLTFAVGGAVILFGRAAIEKFLPDAVFPSVRLVAAFGAAFFVTGFLAILAFDGARGPRWWTAPLIGSLVAAIVFPLIFYPAAYFARRNCGDMHMLIHGGILTGAAFVLLLPFWLLRGIVSPLPGYGGVTRSAGPAKLKTSRQAARPIEKLFRGMSRRLLGPATRRGPRMWPS